MNNIVLNNCQHLQEVFTGLTEDSLLPIFWIKRDGTIIHTNDAACKHLGYSKDELLQLTLFDISPQLDSFKLNEIFDYMSKHRIIKAESQHIRKDKSVVEVEIVKNFFKIDDEEFCISYIFDISGRVRKRVELSKKALILEEINDKLENLVMERTKELKRLNESLQKRVEEEVMLRQKQEALMFEQRRFADMGQMISAIAHQWRQPLNNINLVAQAMKEVQEGEDIGMSFDDLYNSHLELTKHMSDTIDDFRYFFAPKKSKATFSLVKELFATLDLLKAQFDSKNIEATIKCSCKDSSITCKEGFLETYCNRGNDTVTGYPGEIRQVFLNILSNAKDAIVSSNGLKTTDERQINIEVEVRDDQIEFYIFNKGDKIPDDVLNKIFDPYFTTKSEGKGTGIGLYMSKLIIEENMDGKIICENTKDGVLFKLIFPR